MQQIQGSVGRGIIEMISEQAPYLDQIFACGPFQIHHFPVAIHMKFAIPVVYKGHTSTHSGSKVFTPGTDIDYDTSGHILASVISHSFDDRLDTRVPDRKSLPGHSVDISFS